MTAIDLKPKDVAHLIDWTYFFHAWKMPMHAPRQSLLDDAHALLREWADMPCCHSLTLTLPAHSEGDDIVVADTRLPMLRQQRSPFLCLADFVHPESDTVTLFATSVSAAVDHTDTYQQLLAQTVADRLAEATAEHVSLSHPGLRPAIGYPSLPDLSLTFLLDDLIDLGQIGIRLTPSGAMLPHASVCGLVINHPQARYFHILPIGRDQHDDYARRRGFTSTQMQKFLPL